MPICEGANSATWRCARINCDALLATRTRAGPWHIWREPHHVARVIVLDKGEVKVACPCCELLNEWNWEWSPKEKEEA